MPPKDTKKTTAASAPKPEDGVVATTSKETSVAAPAAAGTFTTLEGFDSKSRRGKEGIESSDMKLAYLSAAQKTSKAIDETEDAYIEGLAFGDMYNSESQEIYGKGPITFLPLLHRKRAYLPDANGRMGEAIDWNDPRCDWPTEEEKKNWTGKGKPKPEGVRVYDWVIIPKINGELQGAPMVLSLKSKSFAAGQTLATFVNMVPGDAFTAQFNVKSVIDSNDAGKFVKFTVQPAGKPTVEEARAAEAWYEIVKGKNILVEEDKEETDEPAGGVVDGTVVSEKTGDNTPF